MGHDKTQNTDQPATEGSTTLAALRFNLADLKDFDPVLLVTGDQAVDGFVLSLALAYNDVKTMQWMNFMLDCNRPTPADAITAASGQWNGMRVQVARWLMALTHEILRAIAHAKETGVLEGANPKSRESHAADTSEPLEGPGQGEHVTSQRKRPIARLLAERQERRRVSLFLL